MAIASPSGAAYMWGQVLRSDEEFHQVVTILEHIWYVDGVIKVLLLFYCPLWACVVGASGVMWDHPVYF